MIKKTVPLPWQMINTVLLFLLLAAVLFFQYWPKAQPHWFVAYQWTKAKEYGAGRTCVEISVKSPDIPAIEKAIAGKNGFDSVVITNFREVDAATYQLCRK